MCFCAYKNHLSPVRGELTQLFFYMKRTNKTSRLYIRLTDEENNKLRSLASDYPNLSSYVLDACWHFNSKRHLRKLEYLEEKFALILKLKNDMSHLSSNLNQLVAYTNNCIKMGVYLDNTSQEVIRIQSEILKCLNDYKSEIHSIEKDLKKSVHFL